MFSLVATQVHLDIYFIVNYHFDMRNQIIFIVLILICILPTSIFAVEIAPRISDREIIEKLATIEAGQASLDQRISDLRSEMKSGQEALGKRMDDMSNTMLTLFLGLVALIVGMFAYIAWDRRTMMRPIIDRLDHLEQEFKRDFEIDNEDGSKLTRLIKAMRELAVHDDKIASVLRSFSLL